MTNQTPVQPMVVQFERGTVSIDLPPDSAAYLYHRCHLLADDLAVREDVPALLAQRAARISQEASVLRDLLTAVYPSRGQAEVFGGTAETAALCLAWAADYHGRSAAAMRGTAQEALRSRAELLREWADLAAQALDGPHALDVASESGPHSAGQLLIGLGPDQAGLQSVRECARPEAVTLYTALVNGGLRLLAQAGPTVLSLVAMIASDLHIFADVEGTRRPAQAHASLLVVR